MDLLAGYGSDSSSDGGGSPRSPAAERTSPTSAAPRPQQTANEALATLPAPDADQVRPMAAASRSILRTDDAFGRRWSRRGGGSPGLARADLEGQSPGRDGPSWSPPHFAPPRVLPCHLE